MTLEDLKALLRQAEYYNGAGQWKEEERMSVEVLDKLALPSGEDAASPGEVQRRLH